MHRIATAAVVGALALLAGCSSSAHTAQGSTSGTPSTQSPASATSSPRSTEKMYRIGDSFELPGSNNVGTFKLAVDGVSETVTSAAVQAYADEFGSVKPPLDTHPDPGWKWVIVAVHGTNTGSQPAFFLTQFFVLTAGGKQFDVSLSDSKARDVADGYNYIKNQELSTMRNPEQAGYEWVVYQVPNDLPVQSIRISADGQSSGGPSATVDLTSH